MRAMNRYILAAAVGTLVLAGAMSWANGAADAPLKQNLGRTRVTDGTLTLGSSETSGGADAAHAFGPVVLVDSTNYGGEPGVDAAPDGALYVNGPSGFGGASGSWLYRSTDGGATWAECAATTGPGGGDSNAAINPQGYIVMNDLWLGSLTFYLSKDRCASWTTMPVSTPVPVGDRQWVDYGFSDCEFYQSWNQIPTGIHVQLTRDCGLTWTDKTAASSVDLIGNLVVDHTGRTRNAYQIYTVDGAIKVAIGKVTEGLTGPQLNFNVRTVAAAQQSHDTTHSFPAAAIDAGGNVHAVWQDLVKLSPGNFDSRIMYAYSTDAGITWIAPRAISTGGSNVFPWIDAGAAGKANAAWYQADAAGDPNVVGGPWRVVMAQATALGGAWTTSTATTLSVHNDVICTGGTSCDGDDRDMLDFFEIAHDAAGRAVIAFTKDTAADGGGNGEPRNAFVRQTGGPGIL